MIIGIRIVKHGDKRRSEYENIEKCCARRDLENERIILKFK